jgi:hypothetical protein
MSIGAVSHAPMFTLPPEMRAEVEQLVTEDGKPVDGPSGRSSTLCSCTRCMRRGPGQAAVGHSWP